MPPVSDFARQDGEVAIRVGVSQFWVSGLLVSGGRRETGAVLIGGVGPRSSIPVQGGNIRPRQKGVRWVSQE